MIKYVTYGITKDKFSREKFHEVHKTLPCKPLYGLWGSRVGAEYGWKDWCVDSGFRECSNVNKMEFVLAKDSKILEVHREADILLYIVSRLPQFDYSPFQRLENRSTSIMDVISFDKL